jgi:hypothetical protein
MSALTASREVKEKEGVFQSYKIYQATTIYKGALVCVRTADGYLVPLTDAAGLNFVGVALEEGDNSAGTSGALSIRVRKTGNYEYVKASAVQGDVSKDSYGLDDQTVALTSTNSIKVGIIQEIVDSATVKIKINSYAK